MRETKKTSPWNSAMRAAVRLEIPITVAPGTAERNDYTISGLSNDTVNVTFPSGITWRWTSLSAPGRTTTAPMRDWISALAAYPLGVGLGSPYEADFYIYDDEDPIDCTTPPTPTPTPFITIVDLVDRLEERRDVNNLQSDESDEFQVVASNLNSGTNYRIKVTTNHSGAQFVSDCSDRETEFPVSRVTSYTADLTLYGCDGVNPAEVKAELLVGATVIDTDTHDVIVFPAIAQPTITPQPPEKKNIILRYSSLSHNDFTYQASLFPNGLPVADTHTELFTVVTQRTITGPNVPGEYTVRIRACEDSTFANCGKYSASSNSLRKLMPPQDVDLTPHPLRKAVLSWIGDSTVVGDFKLWAAETGGTLRNLGYFNNSPFEHTITLDDVVNAKGLADEDQFTFEIRPQPVNGAYLTAENVTAVIIDTPILSINGNSSSSRGKGVVKWSVDSNAVEYTLRYRQLDDDPIRHSELSWSPTAVSTSHPWSTPIAVTPASSPTHEETVEPGASSGDMRDPLVLGAIYAFQLNYTTDDAVIFSARESYVWPSDRPAGNGERVATFPLHSPVPGGVYEYRICDAPSLTGMTVVNTVVNSDWKDAVRHALEQWEVATDGLVEMTPSSQPCSNFNTPIDPTDPASDSLLEAVEKEVAASGSTIDVEAVTAFTTGYLTSVLALTQATRDNHNWNEVRIIHPGDFPELQSVANDIAIMSPTVVAPGKFPELAKNIGLASCIFSAGTLGCAQRHPGESTLPLQSTDIFINQSKVGTVAPPLPGGDTSTERSDVPFNECPTGSNVSYRVLVHEAGHALGIRGGNASGFDSGHPAFARSIRHGNAYSPITTMSYNTLAGLGCSPHPFDILAIYALYQSR